MNWEYKKFEKLSNIEIFEIYKNRGIVFVVEQNINYQDADKQDLEADHMFLKIDGSIIAYCRIYPEGDKIKIGRVLVIKQYRGEGISREMMVNAIDFVKKNYPSQKLQIQAQAYLQTFYESLDFEAISEEYLEVGIPHIDMVYKGREGEF